jgi:hypothetical protein
MQNAVSILRDLWRGRLAVAVFALIALMVGALVAYQPSFPPQSRKYSLGVASVRILVDTPDSQVVAIAAEGQATGDLGGHASLLAQLMAQGDAKAAIARRAGISPTKLVTVAPSDPSQGAPAGVAGNPNAEALVFHTLTNDSGDNLPIIGVDAQARTGQRAAELANASVAGLEEYLHSKASVEGIPEHRQLRVRALSVAQGQDVVHGPTLVLAAAATVLTFGALCSILLIGFALARNWRAATFAEQHPELRDRMPVQPVAATVNGYNGAVEHPAPAPEPPARRPAKASALRWNDPPA